MLKKVVSIVFLSLLLALPVLAQDVTDAPTQEVMVTNTPSATATPVIVEPPPPDPVTEEPGDPPATTPENLLGQLFALLKDATYMAWAAAGVLVIVGAIKMVAAAFGWVIEGNVAILIALIVQVAIWITYTIANSAGQGAAYQEWYNRAIDFIRALLPLAGAIFVANWGYGQARVHNTPVIGYKAKRKPAPGIKVDVQSGGEGRDWTKP